jgi:hypothetical protein
MGCMIFSTGVSESYERTLNTLYLTLLNQMRKNNSISYLPDHAILPDTILPNRQILPADSSPPSPFASTRSRACAPRLTRCLGPRRKLSCPHSDTPAAQDPDAECPRRQDRIRPEREVRRDPQSLFSLFLDVCLCVIYFLSITISSLCLMFPYYEFIDRDVMYKLGSLFYAIYFVVSFPMFSR